MTRGKSHGTNERQNHLPNSVAPDSVDGGCDQDDRTNIGLRSSGMKLKTQIKRLRVRARRRLKKTGKTTERGILPGFFPLMLPF